MKTAKKLALFVCLALLMCAMMFTACDSSKTTDETTSSHVHVFGEWATVKKATCIEKGEQERTCACGEKENKIIDALGHTEVIDPAMTASCTWDGKTEGKHCSKCNTVIIAQKTIKATGHTEVIDSAVPATCTTGGKTEGKHCSVCNMVLVQQTATPAVDHVLVDFQCQNCTYFDQKNSDIANGSLAYSYLSSTRSIAFDDCAARLQKAWYFAIYKSDDYSGADAIITAFASYTGVKKDLVIKSVDKYLTLNGFNITEITRWAVLGTNGGAVFVITDIMSGMLDAAKTGILSAKEYYEKMSDDYDNVSKKSIIYLYLSEMINYYNFLISPTGSYSTLSGTLSSFKNNCAKYESQLYIAYQ